MPSFVLGNAMGYIRLVRSGSIHANYSASLYLPKFVENLNFVNQCKHQQLSEGIQLAANNVEINIQNLAKSFADNTDYFKVKTMRHTKFLINLIFSVY